MSVHIGDATKDVTGLAIRKGGALKTITEAWLRVDGVLKQVYATAQMALSSYAVFGYVNSSDALIAQSPPVTATMTGGVGTISYLWTRTDSDPHVWVIGGANTATAAFSTSVHSQDEFTATFICTGTDQAGQVVSSLPVTVTCANNYSGAYP